VTTRERLKRRIDQIRRRNKRHYLAKFYAWAKRGGKYTRNHRWLALARWSEMHRRFAWDKSHKAKRHENRRGARRWASRARHFAHIEKLYRQENQRLRKRRRQGTLPAGDLVTFDGKPHAGWLVRETLIPARASGVWPGISYSGYRTPEYSEALCLAMCGAPTCPGRCAGRNTNHAKLVKPGGATDVTYSTQLSQWEAAHNYPSRHTLPFDLPHHSLTGQ
jgi:hypothetical protein